MRCDLPRSGKASGRGRSEAAPAERSSSSRPPRTSDQEALALRGQGLSFAAIAGRLGLHRSRDALEAFHRALQSSPQADKPRLVSEELVRLEALETRVRSRDAKDPEKLEKRLHALERMRERLPAVPG